MRVFWEQEFQAKANLSRMNRRERTSVLVPHLRLFVSLFILLLISSATHAAKIGEIAETSWTEQALDFFGLKYPTIRAAALGTLLIGFCCGTLGSFLVVRKLALLGDTLSHAVLPGVALGFLWNASKDPWAIFIGASGAGIMGVALVGWIKQTTRLKEGH